METKKVVSELLKNGATQVKDIVVRNVTVTVLDNYVRLGLSIDKEVDGYRLNEETNEYEPANVSVIFASAYNIAALLKDNDEAAFAANHLLKHPDAMGMILSRATITVVQEKVAKDDEYKNPFASDDAATTVFDHDTIVNHIVDLKLSEFGIKRLDRLADMMMGF